MSAYNLQQIESAFSTQRDQYAKFETAVNATAGGCYNPGRAPVTPIIIAEDFSSPDQKKSVLITDDVRKPADEMEGESQGNICILHLHAYKDLVIISPTGLIITKSL